MIIEFFIGVRKENEFISAYLKKTIRMQFPPQIKSSVSFSDDDFFFVEDLWYLVERRIYQAFTTLEVDECDFSDVLSELQSWGWEICRDNEIQKDESTSNYTDYPKSKGEENDNMYNSTPNQLTKVGNYLKDGAGYNER